MVSAEEPISLICHQDGEWRVLKNKKTRTPFGFSSVYWVTPQTAWSYFSASIACFSQSLSLSLFPPPSFSRVHTSIHSAAHAYTHTNMPKLSPPRRILPPFLSIIESGPLCLNTHKRHPSMEESFKYPLLPPPLQQKAAHSSALSAGFWVMREKQRSSSQEEKCACFSGSASLCDQ